MFTTRKRTSRTGFAVARRVRVYEGPFDVHVKDVPDPRVEKPTDAIIRVTTAKICGSDLHPYEGRGPLDEDMALGHENDFTMLSDIFPTGYHGCELAGVGPGDTVAVFGAGRWGCSPRTAP